MDSAQPAIPSIDGVRSFFHFDSRDPRLHMSSNPEGAGVLYDLRSRATWEDGGEEDVRAPVQLW